MTVLLVGLAEDAPTLATLSSTGWSDLRLAWSAGVQALLIGVVGALVGFVASSSFIRSLDALAPAAVAVAGRNGCLAIVITLAAALAPAAVLRRLPLARILSRE